MAAPARAFTLDDLPRAVRRKRRAKENAWASIADAMNPGYYRPKPAADLEVVELRHRSGEQYLMVKTPRGPNPPNYSRLRGEDRFIFELMDGKRTVKDIVVAYFQRYGQFALSRVTALVEELRHAGFFAEPYLSVTDMVAEAKRGRGSAIVRRLRRFAREKRIEFKRAHLLTDWIYRHGGRFAYTPQANVVFAILTVTGLVAFVALMRADKFAFFGATAVSILILYLTDLVATFIHEGGHALTTRHVGRRVNSAGFMLYLGLPMFFIDITDVWMTQRKKRMLCTSAGPYTGFIIGGAAAIGALLLPPSGLSAFLFRLSVLEYYSTLQNLIPFLRLDGFYIMQDAIDTQNLRERAFAFTRYELFGRMRSRRALSREEKGLAVYGIIATLFAAAAVFVSFIFWRRIFRKPVLAAWHQGGLVRWLTVGLIILVLLPVFRALFRLAREGIRRLRFLARRLRYVAQRRWRNEAADLFAALPLLSDLDDQARREIASRASLRRVTAGRSVVVQGEPGTELFLVRSGRLEIVRVGPGGETPVGTLHRGQLFGEIALLTAGPRAATVRTTEPSELFVLDKGTFDRLLAERVDVAPVREALLSVEAIRALGPFAHLDEQDAALIAGHATWENYPPKTAIVRQGREGDAFYVLASGQVEVIEDRRKVRTMGPGAFFGEVALLLDIPRTATVRSITPVRLLRLDRDGFEQVVSRAFRRGRLVPAVDLKREWEH